MPLPRHEVELERQALRDCWQGLRHPTTLPALWAQSWSRNRDYYAARDVEALDREELIELLAWTRRTGMKLFGGALFLGLLIALTVANHMRRRCDAD